nr:hypothetical protein [Tanacetum cinerariifolium]
MLHPELPGPGDRIVDFPEGKVGWMSFSKRPGKNTPQCYTKPLDSLKNWNNRFFWVDECVFPTAVEWRTNASKDRMPANSTYFVEAVRALDTHRTPIQKQPEMLLCLVEMDLFSLIRAPNPIKVKTGSRPRTPHELPLLTLTAPCVIEMDEPATATDSSGVPSTIERSPLDFAHEAEVFGRETAAPEMPPPEDVPVTTAPGTDQAMETIAVEPSVVRESRKRGYEGIDANAPPKSLRRDHADLRPSGSSRGGKLLAAMQLCLASNIFMSEGAPADVSDPDPLAFTDAPSPHPADVVQSSQGVAVVGDPESENVSSLLKLGLREMYTSQNGVSPMVAYSTPLRPARTLWTMLLLQVDALQQQVSGEETLKAAFEDYKRQQDQMVEQRHERGLEAWGGAWLTIPVYPEVRDPRNPWACKEEIGLADAIAANISRVHGVGSVHHARSDRVPVSAPIVVPQGLALLLVDAATQTESDA